MQLPFLVALAAAAGDAVTFFLVALGPPSRAQLFCFSCLWLWPRRRREQLLVGFRFFGFGRGRRGCRVLCRGLVAYLSGGFLPPFVRISVPLVSRIVPGFLGLGDICPPHVHMKNLMLHVKSDDNTGGGQENRRHG